MGGSMREHVASATMRRAEATKEAGKNQATGRARALATGGSQDGYRDREEVPPESAAVLIGVPRRFSPFLMRNEEGHIGELTEVVAVDVMRAHGRAGRPKSVKLVTPDGSVTAEVDASTVLEGLVRKRQVEALAENLPTCACCGEKVAPVDARAKARTGYARKTVLCRACPSCACGRPLSKTVMNAKRVAARGGARHARDVSRHARDVSRPTDAGQPWCPRTTKPSANAGISATHVDAQRGS